MSCSEYIRWIEDNVQDPYGGCREITQKMSKAFPELKRVRGHYYCLVWGERQHWWLRTPEGKVVDPTAAQFPSKGCGEYVEWIEGESEPSGKCLNCGDLFYNGGNFCSIACERAALADFL